jgi:hypothetical protein
VKAVAVLLALTVGFAWAERFTDLAEEGLYADPVVLAKSTPYQRIVMSRHRAAGVKRRFQGPPVALLERAGAASAPAQATRRVG